MSARCCVDFQISSAIATRSCILSKPWPPPRLARLVPYGNRRSAWISGVSLTPPLRDALCAVRVAPDADAPHRAWRRDDERFERLVYHYPSDGLLRERRCSGPYGP